MSDRPVSRTSDFESGNIGATPIHSIMIDLNINKLTQQNQISINKLQQILTFVDKKNAKKPVNLVTLINRLKQALVKQNNFTVYYASNVILSFLNILKKQGYIFNYYMVPAPFFKPFLNFGYKSIFYNRVVIIYLRKSAKFGSGLNDLTLLSKPSRQLFVSYANLRKMIKFQHATSVYILNTTKGMISHVDALKHKIGGNLICAVK